jgi:hypothetical protein
MGCLAVRRRPLGDHSDAAKRVSDAYRLHRTALGLAAAGRWFAAALADGTSDGSLYDAKRDAVRHQKHNEQWYAFVCIHPGDMTVCEAEEFLAMNRTLYEKGIRLADPDHVKGGREVIQRATVEDQRSLIRSIASGGRSRPSGLVYPGE